MRALAIISALAFSGAAFAADDNSCESKAMDKNGNPLTGAARGAFMKKCEKDTADERKAAMCEEKALSKEGKKLSGAAKNASVKKCMSN